MTMKDSGEQTKKSKINMKLQNLIHIVIGIVCIGVFPNAQAVSPAPDGGYPGFTTAEGTKALQSLTTGSGNTAVGWYSLFSNAGGSFNTAIGAGTLLASTADENTATGAGALLSNTTGPGNTANGAFALFSNTTGGFNTANGDSALFSNTIGAQNTATGISALQSNTNGSSNTANGAYALVNNTDGSENTANGMFALFSNTGGVFNTANGSQALYSNTTGTGNAAFGNSALFSNTTGGDNVANGFGALAGNTTGGVNTALGNSALHSNTTGGANTALGFEAGGAVTTANNVICIGANVVGENVSGTTWIANVYGVFTQSGTTAPVVVSDDGQLGTAASSERFKKDIAAMETASEAIMSLRPVTFHYKSDAKGTPQFGLIAEEVAKVNPALVLLDKERKPYTVRYDQVNAMLLNEFLKEHRKVEDLKKELQATVSQQQKQIDALTAGLQKVSAQLATASPSDGGLQASKFATGRTRGGGPAPQMVNNP